VNENKIMVLNMIEYSSAMKNKQNNDINKIMDESEIIL
jgi:hypothetical protein